MTSLDGQPSELVGAALTAGTLLKRQELLDRDLNLEEALTLQAISSVLAERENFYTQDVTKIVGGNPGNVYTRLQRFEASYQLLSTEGGARFPGRGKQQRLYQATELGEKILGFFAPLPPEPATDSPS
jgi:hypothetical protein